MTSFDERMRRRAMTEDCTVPEGFEERLGKLLNGLPSREMNRQSRRRRALRQALLIAAVVAALCVGGVVAAPKVLTMAGMDVPEGFGFLAQLMEFQPYSSVSDASVTDQGYTLTVDGIGIDDAFVTLYYTVTGEEPIPMRDGRPEIWSMKLRADGKLLEFWDYDLEAELVDEYTLRVMQRSPVLANLPDTVELEIYTKHLFWNVDGVWSLRLAVDKSVPAAESLVAEPGTTFTMDGREVTVEKVVIAPSGGCLVLSEAGGNPPLTNFVLRDDRGNVLCTDRWGSVGSSFLPVSNFIEFYGGRTDMTSVTLIPWEADGNSHQIRGGLKDLPLTDEGADNGYTLLSLEVGETEVVGVFRSAGILGESDVYNPDFILLDAEGQSVDLGHVKYEERDRDVETGLWTVTLTYPDAAEEAVASVAGVAFWQPSRTLLEDQAVTVLLK